MNLSRFQFCLSHYCTAIILLIIALASLAIPSRAQSSSPVNLVVSCEDRFPPPPVKVKRKVGDTDVFVFTISATSGKLLHIRWDYPDSHTAEDWGTWTVSTGHVKDDTLTWNPPQNEDPEKKGLRAAGVFNIGVSGNISCGSGGGGSPLTFGTSVNGEVYAKHWKPDPDITGGVMIKPQNQTATPTPTHVLVKQANAIDCEVTEATDMDTWDVLDETGMEKDDTLTYEWKSDRGTQFQDPDDANSKVETVKKRIATWIAPDEEVGDFNLTCVIDDNPKVEPPQSGKRDDPKIERKVTVTVVNVSLNPHKPVLRAGETATFQVSVEPPSAAAYIDFHVRSGDVTVHFDPGSMTLTITAGQDVDNFIIEAWNKEDHTILDTFLGHTVTPTTTDDDLIPQLWDGADGVSPTSPPTPTTEVWTAAPAVSGGEILEPQGGSKTVKPGASVLLQVGAASDNDSKYIGLAHTLHSEEVSYKWKDQDGKLAKNEDDKNGDPGTSDSISADINDNTKATWTAPTKEGTYTVTCT